MVCTLVSATSHCETVLKDSENLSNVICSVVVLGICVFVVFNICVFILFAELFVSLCIVICVLLFVSFFSLLWIFFTSFHAHIHTQHTHTHTQLLAPTDPTPKIIFKHTEGGEEIIVWKRDEGGVMIQAAYKQKDNLLKKTFLVSPNMNVTQFLEVCVKKKDWECVCKHI